MKAKWGLCKVKYELSKENKLVDDFLKMGIGSPIMSLCGKDMTAYMGDNQKVVAFLPMG